MELIICKKSWSTFEVRVPTISTVAKIIAQCTNLNGELDLNGREPIEQAIELADMTIAEIKLSPKEKLSPADIKRLAEVKKWQIAGTKATVAFICDVSSEYPNLMPDSLLSDFQGKDNGHENKPWTFLQFERCGPVQHAKFRLHIGCLNNLIGPQSVLLIREPSEDEEDDEKSSD